MAGTQKFEACYDFFVEHERQGTSFTLAVLAAACGWEVATPRAYSKKKWDGLMTPLGGGAFTVTGVARLTKEQFIRLMSQKNELSSDPMRPTLPLAVERLVVKARDAATLALDVYNRPVALFRTEGYPMMMVVAWTSLFHAIFQRRGIQYHYLNADGSRKLVDGDPKCWELSTCLTKYFEEKNLAVRRNLEFAILLRNKIEHRFVPALDMNVAGECQALLLNFDEFIVNEFGDYYAVREHLALPLQTASVRSVGQAEAMKKFQGREYEELRDFLEAFRDELPDEMYQSPQYSFRVYLVPKIGNRRETSDLALEFVKYDRTKPVEMEALRKQVALIRERRVEAANAERFLPSEVARVVERAIGKPFKIHHHTLAWKKYNVRESGDDPAKCNPKFCHYDVAHGDHVYSQAWVDRLSKDLAAPAAYDELLAFKTEEPEDEPPA